MLKTLEIWHNKVNDATILSFKVLAAGGWSLWAIQQGSPPLPCLIVTGTCEMGNGGGSVKPWICGFRGHAMEPGHPDKVETLVFFVVLTDAIIYNFFIWSHFCKYAWAFSLKLKRMSSVTRWDKLEFLWNNPLAPPCKKDSSCSGTCDDSWAQDNFKDFKVTKDFVAFIFPTVSWAFFLPMFTILV